MSRVQGSNTPDGVRPCRSFQPLLKEVLPLFKKNSKKVVPNEAFTSLQPFAYNTIKGGIGIEFFPRWRTISLHLVVL
ncbi:hypothetical protein KFK09_012461 [Dendrobium nobile]|uniref:Uncharacterized protein n=1 Tax=Dendrobium nobile TaxID=94219 RepID=A0A8T3BFD1_DENNO|nr:hypothetical protein KFK09_012461 [Dendrobium nobile]